MSENEKKKNNKLWLVLLLLVLVAVALVYFLFIGNKAKAVFYPNNGNENIVLKVKKGQSIQAPADPEYDGYRFDGWAVEGELYDLSKGIDKDTAFIAKWTRMYDVCFISDGAVYKEMKVEQNGLVELPEVPTMEGCKFVFWMDVDHEFDVNERITSDKLLTAVFRMFTPIQTMKFEDKYQVNVGETVRPVLIYTPDDWAEEITFESSNTAVATVDENGVVTGVNPGKIVLTATSETGKTAQTEITVVIPVKDFELAETTINLNMNQTGQITIKKCTPDNATDKSLYYESSNTSIAIVDKNGVITPIAGGRCEITVKTSNGIGKKVTVNVTEYKLEVTIGGKSSGEIDTILYYKPSGRPEISPTAVLTTINGSGKSSAVIDQKKLTMLGGDDVLYFAGGTIYATSFGTKDHQFYGDVYTIKFEYTDPSGVVHTTPEMNITVETYLQVYYIDDNGEQGPIESPYQFSPSGENWEQTYTKFKVYGYAPQCNIKSGGASVTNTQRSTPKAGMPKWIVYTVKYQKNNNGNTSTVEFTTPGGQRVAITLC